MVHAITTKDKLVPGQGVCASCGKALHAGRAFVFRSKPAPGETGVTNDAAELAKCLSCALLHLPLLKRSVIAALVVGTVLTALNQGDNLLAGIWSDALYWKIPLTYCVPFLVSTYGALINNRQ